MIDKESMKKFLEHDSKEIIADLVALSRTKMEQAAEEFVSYGGWTGEEKKNMKDNYLDALRDKILNDYVTKV